MSARLLIAVCLAAAPLGCSFDRSGASGGAGDAGGGGGGDQPGAPDAASEPDAAGEPVAAAATCAEAREQGVAASGVLLIDPDGAGAFPAYCDMETDGGGWTLALKIDGRRSTFRYASTLWTSEELLNPDAPDRDTTEAKLDSFNRVAFREVMIRFDTEVDGERVGRWVWMDLRGDNLRALFAAGDYLPVYLGRERWLAAVPGATLQDHCNREGINVGSDDNKVRLGIVGNDESDCLTPESKLGVGGSYSCQTCSACEGGSGLAGPAAGSNDAGCWRVVSFATVLVR
jgi:hypothetical protein